MTTRRHAISWISLGLLLPLLGSVACKDLVGDAVLPAGTQGPEAYNTPAGALEMYQGVKARLSNWQSVIIASGALTDELTYRNIGSGPGSIGATGDFTDERIIDESSNSDAVYNFLQGLRGGAAEAIGLLGTYAPSTSPALRGEMYAIAGYAEMLLAELYCSGVPLSTLDFEHDFTYKPSSTTAEVSQHALVLFDSALALASDSASVLEFARVAKGRVLVDLGRYAEAAQAVAAVPDTFRYQTAVDFRTGGLNAAVTANLSWTVASREGVNGVPFSTADDPRAQVTLRGTNTFGIPLFTPNKYPAANGMPVVLASGVEARLIQAEAELNAHLNDPSWLTTLNTLRTTCTDAAICQNPAPAGTGGVAGLPPLSDPGESPGDTARVNLLFTERAYWLFLTGHRQGDLRRLVRNYGLHQQTVYPTGPYFGGLGHYGGDVNLPIPGSERNNSLFHGCLDRGA